MRARPPPRGDIVTILTALPRGLTQACTGTGTFAWYGSADVAIYVTDPVYQIGIASGCVPNVGYDIGVSLPYLPL